MPSNYPRAPLPLLAILAAPITWLYGRPDLFDSYRSATHQPSSCLMPRCRCILSRCVAAHLAWSCTLAFPISSATNPPRHQTRRVHADSHALPFCQHIVCAGASLTDAVLSLQQKCAVATLSIFVCGADTVGHLDTRAREFGRLLLCLAARACC